jgi:FkbM family methyltransferase
MMLLRSLFVPAILPRISENELVRTFLGDEPGVFVEVGANGPIHKSQTWRLEQDGWTGLLVEPLAECASELRAHRKAIVEEVACGPPELHGSDASLLARGSHSTLTVEGGDADVIFGEPRKVPVRTLDSLLAKAGIVHIDFLSIDVEGYEPEVLRGTNLGQLQPRLVLVEDKARGLVVHRHMVRAGYKRVRRTGLNSWYVPNAATFPVSLFGRLQLLRKCFLGVPFHRLAHRRKRAHIKSIAGSQ